MGIVGGILYLLLSLSCYEDVAGLGGIDPEWPSWMTQPKNIHPEIKAQLRWSIDILERAALSPEHPIEMTELKARADYVVSRLNKTPEAFSPSELGHFGELRAAAYLVTRGLRLVSIRKNYFRAQQLPGGRMRLMNGDLDLVFEDPTRPGSWWVFEVKTRTGPARLNERRVKSHFSHQLAFLSHLETGEELFLDQKLKTAVPMTRFALFILEEVPLEDRSTISKVFPHIEIVEFPAELRRNEVFPSRKRPRP